MISFDLFSQERYLTSTNDNLLSDKRNLGVYSSKEKIPYNILSSSILQNQNNLILNNSNGNINNKSLNSYKYQTSPISHLNNSVDYKDLTLFKSNFDYDIKITELKQKLQMLKEQNKISQGNINTMKLRIKKLQNEEKASLRELEQTKKRILKIKANKENTFYKKNFSKKKINLNLTSIKNRTLNSTNKIINKKIKANVKGNNSQILLKDINNFSNIENYNSFRINLNYKKYSENNCGILSPKMKYFITKNGINNSYDMIQTDHIYNNNENKVKKITPTKKGIKNNKSDLRAQMKQKIIKKLKEHEEQKKKIEDEIKQIEKEEYELWVNFSQNLYSGSTESNTNTNNTNDKKYKMYENKEEEEYEEDENIVNYN